MAAWVTQKAMLTVTRKFFSFVAGAGAGGVILFVVAVFAGPSGVEPESPQTIAKGRFLRFFASLAASKEWATRNDAEADPRRSLEVVSEAASVAVNAYEQVLAGDNEWVDTSLRLYDPSWLRVQRLQCARTHAVVLAGECFATMRMLVILHEDRVGQIASVEVSTMVSHEEGGEAEACAGYVECLAASRIGETVPIPAGVGEPFFLEQRIVHAWAPPVLFDPEKVEELVSESADAVPMVGATAQEAFDVRFAEQMNSFLREYADELRVHGS